MSERYRCQKCQWAGPKEDAIVFNNKLLCLFCDSKVVPDPRPWWVRWFDAAMRWWKQRG